MRTIWKYVVPLEDYPEITVPRGAHLLHMDMQHGKLCAWFQTHDDERGTEVRKFRIYGTGHEVKEHNWHEATVVDGDFVWHIFVL